MTCLGIKKHGYHRGANVFPRGSAAAERLVSLSMAQANAPKIESRTTRRSYSSTRLSPARPCELCYRPLVADEVRFCSSCAPKAHVMGKA
jgi:hypothetical protein